MLKPKKGIKNLWLKLQDIDYIMLSLRAYFTREHYSCSEEYTNRSN